MDAQSLQVQALITFVMPLLIQLAKRSQSRAFAWIDQNKPKICLLAILRGFLHRAAAQVEQIWGWGSV